MRLTILTETSTVGKDTIFFDGLDFASCGIPDAVRALQWDIDAGHIELKSTDPNQDIDQLPLWALNCIEVWQAAYDANNAPPSDAQKVVINMNTARHLLSDSDWTMLPDVQLKNKSEWEAYRSVLRAIAINPSSNAVFPNIPKEEW